MAEKHEKKLTTNKKAPREKVETAQKNNELSPAVLVTEYVESEEIPFVENPKNLLNQIKKIKIDFPNSIEEPEAILKKLKFQVPILVLLTIFLTSLLTFTITKQFEQDVVDQTSFVAKISGGVALTEPELFDVVRQLKATVYWVGPLKNAKYTINASTPAQIYVRYLPDGKGVNDLSPKYRVIGTYIEKNAYSSTLAAGNEANGVSFTTPEGSVVHYNKSAQSNVYVAFQGKDFQIEVFDPSPTTAMALATGAKNIRVIR